MLTNTTQPATDLARHTKRHGRILLQLATGGYYGARRPETGRYEAMYELVAIRAIAESEYQQTDSTNPAVVGCHVWSSADYLSGFGLNPRSLPGVLSSLCKKGLTTHDDSDNNSTTALTATGHAVYLANRTA